MRISDWSSDVCSSDLDDDVAFRRQIAREHDAGFALEIDDDAFLAAIATEKVVALAVTERRERARVVAAAGRFDLQHFGAEIGKRQRRRGRSEEHTSELQSLMRHSYAVFCLKQKKTQRNHQHKT